MDLIDVLQTIGICVGSLALVAIAIMMFVIMSTLAPPSEEIFDLPDLYDHLDKITSDAPPKRSRRTPKSKE